MSRLVCIPIFFLLSSVCLALPSDLESLIDLSEVHQISANFHLKTPHQYGNYISKITERGAGQKALRVAYLGLANAFVKKKQFQEAVWFLRKAGYKREAANLLRELKAFLRTAKIGSYIGASSKTTRYWLQKQMEGVVKDTDAEYEIFAYELSEALKLNFVPVTVKREFQGQAVSLQVYLKSASLPENGQEDSYRDYGYPAHRDDFFFFDFLIGNGDRHNWNWLTIEGEHVVAIDHGHSLGHYRTEFPFKLTWDRQPSETFIGALKRLPLKKLEGLISREAFQIFMRNREALLQFATRAGIDENCEAYLNASGM